MQLSLKQILVPLNYVLQVTEAGRMVFALWNGAVLETLLYLGEAGFDPDVPGGKRLR